MVGQYQPQFVGMTTSNQPGATGDGMLIGEQGGGRLIDMKEIQIHPTVAAGSRILITEVVRGNGAILINRNGKRFVQQLMTRATKPHKPCWRSRADRLSWSSTR